MMPAFHILLLLTVISGFPRQVSFVQLVDNPEIIIADKGQTAIRFTFAVKKGHHIQAGEVKDENAIPTTLSLSGGGELVTGDPVYPEGKPFRVKGEEKAWQVYSDEFDIIVPIDTINIPGGESASITCQLHYQACEKSKCFFPKDLLFAIDIYAKDQGQGKYTVELNSRFF